jgi:diguanylate cyclase (GGDEF)-like protein
MADTRTRPDQAIVKRADVTARDRVVLAVLCAVMGLVAGILLFTVHAEVLYPWPITLGVLLLVDLATARPHAAIGGPRGLSVEVGASGAVRIAALLLLPPVFLPAILLSDLLGPRRPTVFYLWNLTVQALSLSLAAWAFWTVDPGGRPSDGARYAIAIALAVVVFHLAEGVAFTWLQMHLHSFTLHETGLWSREVVLVDFSILLAGASAGTLVLASPWLSPYAVMLVALVALLVLLLDRSNNGTNDAKTGLLQLPAFKHWASRFLATAERQGSPVSLLMIDLDHFRRLNETYGHPVGDQVIVAVARLLQDTLRASDLAGRFGGEEYVVLLPGNDRDAAVATAERLRRGIENLRLGEGPRPVLVTASIGVATRGAGEDLDALITMADNALYRAKHAGRNRTSVA